MATQKVTPKLEKARKVQIGDGINKAILDKGKAINKEKCAEKKSSPKKK